MFMPNTKAIMYKAAAIKTKYGSKILNARPSIASREATSNKPKNTHCFTCFTGKIPSPLFKAGGLNLEMSH